MKELGIKNPIIELDLVWAGIDYSKFKVAAINPIQTGGGGKDGGLCPHGLWTFITF